MARLNTSDNALFFLKTNKITNFEARGSAEKDNTLHFKTDPEKTDNENYDSFMDVIKLVHGSYYLVEKKNHGAHRIEVINKSSEASKQEQQPAMIGNVYNEERVQELVEQKLNDYKREQEIKALRQEIKDLQKVSPMEKFLERLEPAVPHLINGLMGKFLPTAQVGLAGIEKANDNTNEDMNEQHNAPELSTNDSERIDTALEKWANADPDFISLLEKIADLADAKDNKYTMAKSFI